MREKFKKLPGVLQKQITSRLALGYVLLALGAALLASLRNILLCLPGFAAGAFLLVNAARLFFRAISGDCLYLHGVCKEIEKRKRFLLEVEDKRIQIAMGKPIKGLCVGDAVMLTILADTPVYEQDGVYRVFSYIALERIEKD